jgi:hypothetical protein
MLSHGDAPRADEKTVVAHLRRRLVLEEYKQTLA